LPNEECNMSVEELAAVLSGSARRRMKVYSRCTPTVWNVLVRSARITERGALNLSYAFPRISENGGEWRDLSVDQEDIPASEISSICRDDDDRIHFTWSCDPGPEREYIIFPLDDSIQNHPEPPMCNGCFLIVLPGLLFVMALVCCLSSLF
jgi:hypothetical protein